MIFNFLLLITSAFFVDFGVALIPTYPHMQTFILFKDPYPQSLSCDNYNCSKPFHGNLKDLGPLWGPVLRGEVKSWCSVTQGMWLFYSEPNFSPTSPYWGYIKTRRGSNPEETMHCANIPQGQGIRSIRHMSHANINVPAISLFTSASGPGGILQHELFVDGEYLSLPEPLVNVSAYSFSGFRPWTVYEEREFTGKSTCLTLPPDYEGEGQGLALMSTNLFINLTIGSLKGGCTGIEDTFLPSFNSITSVFGWKSWSNTTTSRILLLPRNATLPGNVNVTTTPTPPTPPLASTTPGFIMITVDNKELKFAGKELVLPQALRIRVFQSLSATTGINNNTNTGNRTTTITHWNLCSDLDFTGECHCFEGGPEGMGNTVTFGSPKSVMSTLYGEGRCPINGSSNNDRPGSSYLLVILAFYFFINNIIA